MAPAEAAQEGAESGRRLDGEAQDPARTAGAEGVGIIDAVPAGERRHHEGQKLVASVRPARHGAEIKMLVDQLAQAQMVSQGGRQEEPRVGHQAIIVEGRVEAVEAVR